MFSLFLVLVFCVRMQCQQSNSHYTEGFCHPASCADGSCYCTDKKDGWYNGGGFCSKNFKQCECTCPSDRSDRCMNERCLDDWTSYMIDEELGWVVGNVGCYYDDHKKGRMWGGQAWHDNCYRTTVPCRKEQCGYGESLVGCGRVSAGRCEKCQELGTRNYWADKGSCTQNTCTEATVGKFVAKACTPTTDAVISDCSVYPGNKGHIVHRPDRPDTYYCPGGGVVLPLPENSQPTEDYSNFECLPGYYLDGISCTPCMPGFACRYGRKYECPAHYYTSTSTMSYCTRCTRSCTSSWQYPVRCAQGSTSNPGCVSCGACAFDPKRGMSCVMESYEMQGLDEFCKPTNENVALAVCQKV
jgi:hypothetical protein